MPMARLTLESDESCAIKKGRTRFNYKMAQFIKANLKMITQINKVIKVVPDGSTYEGKLVSDSNISWTR